ncbi:cytochrome P450 [Russula vinacea]|nr:cytochrome P450 [Russula vinacea]
MSDEFILKLSSLAGALLVVFLFISHYFKRDQTLEAIPTIGFSDPILSYFSALQFNFDGFRMLKEGYQNTRPGLFKIANARRWMVLAAGSGLIDDIRKAPDDVLSRNEPTRDSISAEYTLNILDPSDRYSVDVIRSKLMRDVAATFNETREELVMAMDDFIPTREDSRDRDYLNLNVTYAANVVKFGMIISWFPKPFKLVISRMLSNLPSQIQQEIDFIKPMVEERFAKLDEYREDWDDKPNDLLMWHMSEAKGVERSVEGLARRLLVISFASVHSTSTTLTQVLYRLLTNPEYIKPLRQEVDAVITEEGWTKAGMDKMYKIDSFIRETQRVDGFALRSLNPFQLPQYKILICSLRVQLL